MHIPSSIAKPNDRFGDPSVVRTENNMKSALIGYLGIATAVFFFGSNFIPIKKYETGDGMFFQFVVCMGTLCGSQH